MAQPGFVYTLYLENDCYYVGYSSRDNIQTRICSHFIGAGSKFTQINKPISIIDVKPGGILLETLTTLALMCNPDIGWEKVRGGSYTNIEMKEPASLKKAKHYLSYYK